MEQYLLFLNSLEFPLKFTDIQESHPHEKFSLSGWQGLKSLHVLSENNEIYAIDIRYAWGEEIFRQNLIDSINSQDGLLNHLKKNDVSHCLRKLVRRFLVTCYIYYLTLYRCFHFNSNVFDFFKLFI